MNVQGINTMKIGIKRVHFPALRAPVSAPAPKKRQPLMIFLAAFGGHVSTLPPALPPGRGFQRVLDPQIPKFSACGGHLPPSPLLCPLDLCTDCTDCTDIKIINVNAHHEKPCPRGQSGAIVQACVGRPGFASWGPPDNSGCTTMHG